MNLIPRAVAAGIVAISIAAAPTALHAANMKVVKTLLSSSPAHPGVPIVYQIVVSNTGALAPTVNLNDDIDTKSIFNSLSAPSGWACSTPPVDQGGTVQCSFQNMDTGASATFTLSVTILPEFVPLETFNTAVVSNSGTEDDPSDNTSTVETPVTPAPPMSVPVRPVALIALAALLAGAGILLKR